MNRLYLDNASTTFPKPSCVTDAVAHYMKYAGTNIGRGNYSSAYSVEDTVFETREALVKLFHGPKPSNVIFTGNVTESLNLALKGLLNPNDRVVTSSMEHNAVMRPLVQLEKKGVTFERVSCSPDGTLDPHKVEAAITPKTRAVVMTHASNVSGTVLPITEVGKICASRHVLFIVDAAQTAGVIPLDMHAMHIDMLCITGHKGLLGPQGIGALLLTDKAAAQLDPLVTGGTGSMSDSEEIPATLPDRFEAGTPNLPGIMGLHASLAWLCDREIDSIYAHEIELTASFLKELEPLKRAGSVNVIGLPDTHGRVGVVSIQTLGHDLAFVARDLDAKFGIQTRVGLHCAPSAHKTLKTFPTGTIRFSFGWANTMADVDAAISALKEILGTHTGIPSM